MVAMISAPIDGAADRTPPARDGAATDEDRRDRVERIGARDLQVDVLGEAGDQNSCDRDAKPGDRKRRGNEQRDRQPGGARRWLVFAQEIDFHSEPRVAHAQVQHERQSEEHIDRERQAEDGARQEMDAGPRRRGDVARRKPADNALLDGAGADCDDDRIGADQTDQRALDREDRGPRQAT